MPDVGESSLDQQQASGTFQDGYANLLSGLDSHDIPATANGHAAAADTLAPSQHQGGSHSRRVSWDDSIFDGPTASTVARIPGQAKTYQMFKSHMMLLQVRLAATYLLLACLHFRTVLSSTSGG